MRKAFLLLLCAAILLTAAGCSGTPETTTETPLTDAPTTQATEPVIDTPEELLDALATQQLVTLEADVTMEETPVVCGGELNGGGHTITGPVYDEYDVATENGLSVMSGTVRDVKVTGAYRCIGDSFMHARTGEVRLYNVTADGDTYALNFGYGHTADKLIAEGSSFYGWSSYTGFSEALFTDCTFGWDSTGSQGNLRPYIHTTLINCRFEGKTDEAGNAVPFNIHFKTGSDGVTLILQDCYVGDTLITEENLSELLSVSKEGNMILIRNS